MDRRIDDLNHSGWTCFSKSTRFVTIVAQRGGPAELVIVILSTPRVLHVISQVILFAVLSQR